MGLTLLCCLLPLAVVACGGGDKKNPTGSTSNDLEYLRQHNARFNDGRTVRWPTLPIRVFANGIARENEVTEWTSVTGGAVTFTFVGSAAGADITFRFGGGTDVCGETTVRFRASGEIVAADVQVVQQIFRSAQCAGGRTVVHEVGHAIGHLDHSADGGLMDPDGGNGMITAPVANMFRLLYSMAPGTLIGALSARLLPERPARGERSITIVDSVRR
jgi:hypothetical protein